MVVDISQLIVWLVIGAITGTLAAWVMTRKRSGFGWLVNVAVGLVGVAIGNFLFQLLDVTIRGLTLVFTGEEFVAALIGSAFVALVVSVWLNRQRKS